MNTGGHPRDLAVVDAEFAFTWSDFRQIAEFVHSEAGIVLAETKANLVYTRLAKRLRAIGLRNFREYCALITSPDGADERQAMIAAMTTNVTRFFREAHHFEYLRAQVFPRLLETAQRGSRVRIWSAGCSSGEEAYSIALVALELAPEAAALDFRILATDIDPEMLQRGKSGTYPARQMNEVPPDARKRWFVPVTASFAHRLDSLCRPSVAEAEDGCVLSVGRVYLAPGGDTHLEICGTGTLRCRLWAGPAANGHRPSVDVLFESVAAVAGDRGIGAILTGMGRDGASGLLAMRKRGAATIGQDEASSIVYGMPRVAFEIGAIDKQVPLERIGPEILDACRARAQRGMCHARSS